MFLRKHHLGAAAQRVRHAGDALRGDSPEGRLAGARLAVGTTRAAWRAHVALGREAVAGVVHLLAKIGLRAGLVGLLAGGLALELVVVLEAHDCGSAIWLE
jgi:hypothetical protein